MKIYFCGSIRGGRDLSSSYLEIIELLRGYGEVLTEHVARDSVIEHEKASFTDKQIYERDLSWLEESDLVVAEVSVPSLGVGYEIAYAVQRTKPVLCLYHRNSESQLSAMIAGCDDLDLITYTELSKIKEALNRWIKSASSQSYPERN